MSGFFFAAGALACLGSFYLGTLWRRDRKTTEASGDQYRSPDCLSPADAYLLRGMRDAHHGVPGRDPRRI